MLYGNSIVYPIERPGKFQRIIPSVGRKGDAGGKRAGHGAGGLYRQHGPAVWKGIEGTAVSKTSGKKLEERGLKQTVLRAVGKLEAKVYAARAELLDLKDQFIDGVNRTVNGFREKGILAVYKTIDFLGIKRGLVGVKRHLHQSLETADRGIASLGNIGDEMHGVRTHLGNIKRELAGKEPLTVGSREMERGAVFQMQKMLYGTMGVLGSMEKRTDRTIRRLDSFGEKVQGIQKPSVRGSLKAIQAERHTDVSKSSHRRVKEAVR